MELNELYQDLILDHFKNPRCQGCVENASATQSMHNPLCGDQVYVSIAVKDKTIPDIKFSGHGCSISQASASMMSEVCHGKSIAQVENMVESFKALMRGEKTPESLPDLGDAIALQGVRKFAARLRCVLLPWEALERCLEKVKNQ